MVENLHRNPFRRSAETGFSLTDEEMAKGGWDHEN